MRRKIFKKEKGFALLFTIIVVSIILSIALSLSGIAYKESTFSVSAKSSNEAYFAADTGAECALYWDDGPVGSWFGVSGGGPQNPLRTYCAGNFISISGAGPIWTFTLLGLGANQKGCATVTVDHTNPYSRKITSKGYNIGGDAIQACALSPFLAGRVERTIEVTY